MRQSFGWKLKFYHKRHSYIRFLTYILFYINCVLYNVSYLQLILSKQLYQNGTRLSSFDRSFSWFLHYSPLATVKFCLILYRYYFHGCHSTDYLLYSILSLDIIFCIWYNLYDNVKVNRCCCHWFCQNHHIVMLRGNLRNLLHYYSPSINSLTLHESMLCCEN